MSGSTSGAQVTPGLRAILSFVAVAAVAVPAWVVTHPPAIAARPAALRALAKRTVVPATVLPPVEPVEFVALSPQDAKAFNDSVPFVTGPNPAARPFRIAGDAASIARATDCLAAAQIYEAGNDPEGQRAVAQVILNRLRHPAFPKTVCGVVFEGQERSTGCQFTFTCDGALTRWIPTEAMWRDARALAAQALSGRVYKPVGYATHYHTDWVVPYWQSSLDKIAAVHSHLFFRWAGWWGTPPAFNRTVASVEPSIAKLATISDAHRDGGVVDETEEALAAVLPLFADLPGDAPIAPGVLPLAQPTALKPLAEAPDTFLVVIDPRQPDALPALAQRACGERLRCKLMGWSDARLVPAGMTMSPQQYTSMGFSYLRDRSNGFDRVLWNCGQFKRADTAQCMRGRGSMTAVPVTGSAPPPATPATTRGPAALHGVRRAAPAAATPTEAKPAASGDQAGEAGTTAGE
ncbi:cell wall hydrolase [uncultured Sphingomonas sp.]|uniref:cell wall hydrolase n=1 Tax=uncultured Sphingomonas sp. TaxID=158754 RepID=UPI00261C633A|nr:cell wall hydrolase [uncultured Sphingomonas sp.]